MNELIRSQFNEYLNKFLLELGKSSKKLKKIIDSEYSDINDDKYVEFIKSNIYVHKEKFLGKEEELDEFFKNNSIELLEKINLSDVWNKSEKDNKNAIIQYVKVFVIMFESTNNDTEKKSKEKKESQEESQESEESSEENVNLCDDKFEKLLKESLLNNDKNINENMDNFYENMKDSNNSIIDLAKNIADDLKNDSGGDPNNLLNMFSNGNGLNGLITSITSKLDNEIKSGKLDQNKLFNDAQQMMGNNKNLFGDLFKSMTPQNTTNNNSDENEIKTKKKTKKTTAKKNKKK
tara:strand:+ start:639 stop:1514 length:876 start_codon:yes stop_codon:yes gene_type:complete